MASIKGRPGGRGKKGVSGRKSAYQERADADFLWKVFTDKFSKEELTNLLTGKHSIKDAWIAKAYSGNERFIQQIVHKLFPDNLDLTTGGEQIIFTWQNEKNNKNTLSAKRMGKRISSNQKEMDGVGNTSPGG